MAARRRSRTKDEAGWGAGEDVGGAESPGTSGRAPSPATLVAAQGTAEAGAGVESHYPDTVKLCKSLPGRTGYDTDDDGVEPQGLQEPSLPENARIVGDAIANEHDSVLPIVFSP